MRESLLQVAILAAGQGKRMHSDLPKVLHPLGGRALLGHVIDAARQLRPSRLCVVVGHRGDRVREALHAESGVDWVEQRPQLGTGHAVQQAMPRLGREGIVLVLYGDVPLIAPETLRRLVAIAGEGRLALLTQELEDPYGYGRIVREAGRVTRIVEEKDASPAERAIREVNTGILAAPVERLSAWLSGLRDDNAQREYYLTDAVGAAVAQDFPVEVCHPGSPDECLGVNSKTDLARLERRLQMSIAEKLLQQGVTLADPARLDVRGELACGRDVFIDVNCIFEGRVRLGDGVRVGASCILRDVTIGSATEIKPFSIIEEADVGAGARIGPYARIRPGTKLEDEVHIGNFVEVKASHIGFGSKANHLAYVGDSTVGRNVNVGAGTITCNYDGARKHRTTIEDDVHIGSDVQLVAPVTVGKGATIGAGATIVKDVPPGGLTLTEAKQVTRPNWQRPKK